MVFDIHVWSAGCALDSDCTRERGGNAQGLLGLGDAKRHQSTAGDSNSMGRTGIEILFEMVEAIGNH